MNMVTINTTSLTVHFAQHTSECKRNKTNNKNKGFTRVKEKILMREKIQKLKSAKVFIHVLQVFFNNYQYFNILKGNFPKFIL